MDFMLLSVLGVWVLASIGLYFFHVGGVELPLWLRRPSVLAWVGAVPLAVVLARALRDLLGGRDFSRGDHIVYVMPKHTMRPGPRAEQVYASPHGEGYSYIVRKLWTVARVPAEGELEVVTPGGKRHRLAADDPHLHRAGPWEALRLRLRWHKRFPTLAEAV